MEFPKRYVEKCCERFFHRWIKMAFLFIGSLVLAIIVAVLVAYISFSVLLGSAIGFGWITSMTVGINSNTGCTQFETHTLVNLNKTVNVTNCVNLGNHTFLTRNGSRCYNNDMDACFEIGGAILTVLVVVTCGPFLCYMGVQWVFKRCRKDHEDVVQEIRIEEKTKLWKDPPQGTRGLHSTL